MPPTPPKCDRCPMPATMPCNPTFCEWIHSDDPVKVAHVRAVAGVQWGKPAFPSLAEQAKGAAKAAAKFLASGLELATPAQVASREAICRGCSHFRDGRCGICGCRTQLKIRSAAEHCPLDPPKW